MTTLQKREEAIQERAGLCCSPEIIIHEFKLKKMRWAEHVARMGQGI